MKLICMQRTNVTGLKNDRTLTFQKAILVLNLLIFSKKEAYVLMFPI